MYSQQVIDNRRLASIKRIFPDSDLYGTYAGSEEVNGSLCCSVRVCLLQQLPKPSPSVSVTVNITKKNSFTGMCIHIGYIGITMWISGYQWPLHRNKFQKDQSKVDRAKETKGLLGYVVG